MHNRSQLLLDDDAMKASARERVREAGIQVDTPKTVLVVVDVQWDFFDPAGALYVGGSEALPEKIAELEAKLYGTETTDPYLPLPDEVFEILKAAG